MRHEPGYYTHYSVRCPQCGSVVAGWQSVTDPKKRYYQREGYECVECGYSYCGHDRELSPKQAASLRTDLGDTYATAQCPRCHGKANSYSRSHDVPTNKELFQKVIDRVCEQCHFWHIESTSQLTLEYVNR